MFIGNQKEKMTIIFMIIGFIFIQAAVVYSAEFDNLPARGMVTMVDLGAKKCIPCKMMAPIMKKMEKLYKGKAVIAFIDVWENREQVQRFKIRGIPTQIFFNKEGREVYRHLGFISEKDIKSQLVKMGVEAPAGYSTSNNG